MQPSLVTYWQFEALRKLVYPQLSFTFQRVWLQIRRTRAFHGRHSVRREVGSWQGRATFETLGPWSPLKREAESGWV